MSKWVSDGLIHLSGFSFNVDESKNSGMPQEGVTVKTSLTRAYTWQIGMNIFSMVALKAEFTDKNGVLQQKYYRAHGDKTNMWGADSKYVTYAEPWAEQTAAGNGRGPGVLVQGDQGRALFIRRT